MAHLSYETVNKIISGDMFANLNIVEMEGLKWPLPYSGDSGAPQLPSLLGIEEIWGRDQELVFLSSSRVMLMMQSRDITSRSHGLEIEQGGHSS